MGLKLIGVSCLEVGVLHPSILKTERPPRHLISAGLIPHHEHLLARSALPRERVRSMARRVSGLTQRSPAGHWGITDTDLNAVDNQPLTHIHRVAQTHPRVARAPL